MQVPPDPHCQTLQCATLPAFCAVMMPPYRPVSAVCAGVSAWSGMAVGATSPLVPDAGEVAGRDSDPVLDVSPGAEEPQATMAIVATIVAITTITRNVKDTKEGFNMIVTKLRRN